MIALGAHIAALPVAMAQSELGKVTSSAEGVVIAARSWDITTEFKNKINRLHFVQGQFVKRGDLLVEFNTRYEKIEVELAETAVARANAKLNLSREIVDRQRKLKDKAVGTIANYNEAVFLADMAKADLRKAEIKLEKSRSILDDQTLYAPFDGQLSAPRYRENANVGIGVGGEIATIVQLDPIHVLFSVPYERVLVRMQSDESDAEVKASITVVLELPNGTTYPHHGKIISAGFDVDPKTGLGTVLVEFPNPRRVLRPGLKVTATMLGNFFIRVFNLGMALRALPEFAR